MSISPSENNPEPGQLSQKISPDTRALLLRELDERHLYSRFIAQAYLAWYTFFVTLNLYIMGSSLQKDSKILDYQVSMTVAFLVFNIIGMGAILVIIRGTGNQRSRIDEVIKILNGQDGITVEDGDRPGFFRRIYNAFGRTCRVIKKLLRKRIPETEVRMISPYPHYLFKLLSAVFFLSHVVLICFWLAFLIYGFKTQ